MIGVTACAAVAIVWWRARRRRLAAPEPEPAPTPRRRSRGARARPRHRMSALYASVDSGAGEGAPARRVVCYGDSNTWGFDAFSALAARDAPADACRRLADDARWPRVAARALGARYAVLEHGLNGRTTVHDDALMGEYDANGRRALPVALHSQKPVDLVVVMLGTNDLKRHLALLPEQVAKGAQLLVEDITRMSVARAPEGAGAAGAPSSCEVLLIAPPHLSGSAIARGWGFDESAPPRSRALGEHYAAVARQAGCHFLDASRLIKVPDERSGGDGVHLSAENCAVLGEAVAAAIRDVFGDGTSHAEGALEP